MFEIVPPYSKKIHVYINNVVYKIIYIVVYKNNLVKNIKQKLKLKKVFYSA